VHLVGLNSGSLNELLWQSYQLGHIQTERLLCFSVHQFIKEIDSVLFSLENLVVHHFEACSWHWSELLGQGVVVSCEETFAVNFSDNEVKDWMCQCHSIVGRSASSKFVDNCQRPVCRVVDDRFGLLHFDKECTLAWLQFIRSADTSEYSINYWRLVWTTRNVTTHLCHYRQKARCSQNSRFSTHVWTS